MRTSTDGVSEGLLELEGLRQEWLSVVVQLITEILQRNGENELTENAIALKERIWSEIVGKENG
jgi:hypothetical protein